jgi:hypothetical protein
MHVINHSNITTEKLNRIGVHLLHSGNELITNNFINYLTPSWNAATAPVETNNNNHYFSSNENRNFFNEIK